MVHNLLIWVPQTVMPTSKLTLQNVCQNQPIGASSKAYNQPHLQPSPLLSKFPYPLSQNQPHQI